MGVTHHLWRSAMSVNCYLLMQVVHRVGVFDAEEDGSDDEMMACEPDSLQGIK
jgi:hypothetical protein